MELRDAGLGHAEHLTDLAQGQVLVVVEGDHELLALGQRRDRVGDPVAQLGLVDDRLRVGRAAVGQRVEQRHLVAGRVGHVPELVERDDRRVRDLHQRVMDFVDTDPELGRHLLVGRGALQPGLELHVDALDLPSPRPDRARHPVERPQLVDDRAADPGDRVGLELDLPRQVKPCDRGDQPPEPVRDQVGLLDVRRQPGAHPARDVLDERRKCEHEPLAGAFIPGGFVAPPQVLELNRCDVGFQFSLPGFRFTRAGGRERTLTAAAATLPECRPE